MRSKAQIKTHPIHPILVGFPIAFFSGTVFFDILWLVGGQGSFGTTAHYLLIAGIIMAVITAIPGFIDFLYTVPPASSAKKRGATHGLLNLCMLALFALALVFRPDAQPGVLSLVLECVGLVIMGIAGWLGGTMVHRNQIGVDPRYAFAGKWKEIRAKAENGIVDAGTGDDLKRDQMKLIRVEGKRIVLAKASDGFVAFDDHCTHRGGSLAGGMMICDTVQCPWHGSQFDVKTGAVKAGPADKKAAVYRLEVIKGRILIHL
jgi:uncharacterized membrane protein/nitrite reductase/ring-hydroxylating ferredoxin subunit